MSMPVLKLRQVVGFPGNIVGGVGIDATKAHGTVTIDTDWSDFSSISAIPTSPTSYILTFDSATNAYVLVPSHLLGGAVAGVADVTTSGTFARQINNWVPTVTEAPLDGTLYGRQSISGVGSWVVVPSSGGGGGIPEPANDGVQYGRKTAGGVSSWTPTLTDALSDGHSYGRNNNAWARVVGEAPSDGTLYGRQSISGVGSWVAVPSSGGGGGATSDYPTRTSVASSFISTSTSYLRIAGYATPGDGGAALYKRVVTAPSHSGKIQSADGAWWEIAEPQLNIQMFGGKGDNSTDNYPPLLAAYTVINARLGGAVYLPAGQYKFVTSPAFTFAADHFSIRVFGDGAKATSLIFPTTDGLSFTWFAKQNSVHIESMALLTSTNGQKGLSLIFPGANDQPEDNVNSYIQNVTFMGSDNLVEGGANGWGYAFFVDRVSGTNLVNSTVWGGSLITHKGGVGAFYTGATSVFSVGHNIVNFTSANLTDGVLVGTFVQGVQIINSNFSACDNSGVRVAAGGSGLAEVSIQGSQITTIGRAIDIESSIQNISVQNNPYIACTIGGVVTAAGTSVTGIISGNQFIANDAGAGGGIIIDSVSQYGPWGPLNILGNSISGFNFAIVLGANSSGVRSGWNTGLSNNSWDFIDPSSSNNIVLPPA